MAKTYKTEKYCGGCHFFKPKSEFNKRKASHDGLAHRCRACQKKYAAWYRKRYPRTPEQLAATRQYNKRYREEKGHIINTKRKMARAEAKRVESIRIEFAGAYGEYQ